MAFVFIGLIFSMVLMWCLGQICDRRVTTRNDPTAMSRSASSFECFSDDDNVFERSEKKNKKSSKSSRNPDRSRSERCSSEPRSSAADLPEYDLFSAPMMLRIRGNRQAISGVSMRFNSPCKFQFKFLLNTIINYHLWNAFPYLNTKYHSRSYFISSHPNSLFYFCSLFAFEPSTWTSFCPFDVSGIVLLI